MDLRLEGVGHAYDTVTVLEDITLDVPSAHIVCIVGPSGCGKSTLLRFIGGLEQPTKGRVVQVGSPPQGSLNPLTYVFQDFALLPWRTVEGNISLVLEDHGIKGSESREIISDVLARTNLTGFEKALPKQLSGGMKQRVAIARALAVRPAVMLMDEPLSALDSQTRELLMDDLVGLWTRNALYLRLCHPQSGRGRASWAFHCGPVPQTGQDPRDRDTRQASGRASTGRSRPGKNTETLVVTS